MSNRAPAQAAVVYLKLLEIDSAQVLPRQLQLDIANQLMSEGKWKASATAYERFLAQYSNYEYAEQVHLMLGLLYGRYLERPEEALEQLNQAKNRLSDAGQVKMCAQEIARLENNK
jgi:outer membrane protein assembly factor BamD (BamD/ComL family)